MRNQAPMASMGKPNESRMDGQPTPSKPSGRPRLMNPTNARINRKRERTGSLFTKRSLVDHWAITASSPGARQQSLESRLAANGIERGVLFHPGTIGHRREIDLFQVVEGLGVILQGDPCACGVVEHMRF